MRASVPVTLAEAPDERLPEGVEAAAYYVVAEALTNVAKYAQTHRLRPCGSHARTAVRSSRSRTTASAAPIRCSARACAASPTGSRRSTASFSVDSVPGEGTTIRAEIPVESA